MNKEKPKLCEYCNEGFITEGSGNYSYCSMKCRREATLKSLRERRNEIEELRIKKKLRRKEEAGRIIIASYFAIHNKEEFELYKKFYEEAIINHGSISNFMKQLIREYFDKKE